MRERRDGLAIELVEYQRVLEVVAKRVSDDRVEIAMLDAEIQRLRAEV